MTLKRHVTCLQLQPRCVSCKVGIIAYTQERCFFAFSMALSFEEKISFDICTSYFRMNKKKMKLTQEFVSIVCVCVCASTHCRIRLHYLTVFKPHNVRGQTTRHLKNKADGKYPEQPQEGQASTTTKTSLGFFEL